METSFPGIFKNEAVLFADYLPEKLPFREAQLAELASCLKPLLHNKPARNAFLYGSTGTGKTASTRYVLRELQQESSKVKSIYINCFQHKTRAAVLSAICLALGIALPRRGIASDEMLSGFMEALRKGILPIIVLDEIDQMKKSEVNSLLYDIVRLAELAGKNAALIMISNEQEALAMLDARVRSSLVCVTIEFQQYTPAQLKQILRERAELAFVPGSYEEDAIALAAAYGAKQGGDARVAIQTLLHAARLAEQKGEKLKAEHVREAFAKVVPRAIEKAASFLDEAEKTILAILAERGSITSGMLYEEFAKRAKQKLSERQIRTKINELVKKKLIEAEELSSGIWGRTRILKLAQPKEKIKEMLES